MPYGINIEQRIERIVAYKKNATVREDHFKRPFYRDKENRETLNEFKKALSESGESTNAKGAERPDNETEKKIGRQSGTRNITWEERQALEILFNDPTLDYPYIAQKTGRAYNTLCKEFMRGIVQKVTEDGEKYYYYDAKVAQADAEEKKAKLRTNACKDKSKKVAAAVAKADSENN